MSIFHVILLFVVFSCKTALVDPGRVLYPFVIAPWENPLRILYVVLMSIESRDCIRHSIFPSNVYILMEAVILSQILMANIFL